MDDRQRAKELLAAQLPEGDELIADILADNFDLQFLDKETVIAAITAALRSAPEAVALRVAMQSLEQIANAPDDQGAKFNAMGALRFLQTQPVELRAAPEGFVLVPVEATEEMVDASLISVPIAKRINPGQHLRVYGARAWAAMLAARPQGVKDA